MEARVPHRSCVALGTVRRPKLMKSVCLVVQTKGGATRFTTCLAECSVTSKSLLDPARRRLLRATPGPRAPAGHLMMNALLPAPNPGSISVTEAPKLQSVHALVERLNQVASVPLHDHAPGAPSGGSELATGGRQKSRQLRGRCQLQLSAFCRGRARARGPRSRTELDPEARRITCQRLTLVPYLAGADPAANHGCLPTSVSGRSASLERMQCGCVAAQRLPFISSRRGRVPPTRGHQQHDPRGCRRRSSTGSWARVRPRAPVLSDRPACGSVHRAERRGRVRPRVWCVVVGHAVCRGGKCGP